MCVPEAAVDKHCQAIPRQDDVGPPWQISPVQPEAVSPSVKQSPNGEFRPGVRPTDSRHIGATGGFAKSIRHNKLALPATSAVIGPAVLLVRVAPHDLVQEQLEEALTGSFSSLTESFSYARCHLVNAITRLIGSELKGILIKPQQ